ncbi:MAG: cohesin domain-containing protein [Candidatus Zixiibacteriota bacterium]
MKILKITLCYLILTMTLTGVSYAQIIDCNAIGESPNDTVKFVFSQGLPGDTVNVPLHITNDTGIAGFSIYIEYDSTILKPVITAVDTLYDSLGTMIAVQEFYEYLVTGRFLKTDTTQGPFGQVIDTVTSVLVVSETDFISPDSITNSRLKILALPDFINPETVIIPGSDVIMYLRFVIASNASLGAFARMDFYKETIEILDTVFPFPVIRTDCIYSRYGDASGIIDVRFTPVWATVQVEAAGDLPTIQSFAANPSTINPGSSTTLSWSVANATSLSINQGVGSVTPVTSGSVSVSPSTTITYTLTATNTAGSVQQSTTVFIAVKV